MALVNKEEILKYVKIIDIAERFNLDLEPISSGDFNFRCRCPFHKNGQERTPSLYISETTNSFYCYGCQAGTNVIDFYILHTDKDFIEAIHDLKEYVGDSDVETVVHIIDTFPIKLKISNLFRIILTKYPDKFNEIEKIIKQTDQYLVNIDSENIDKIQKTQKLYNSLVSFFKKRLLI